MYRDSDERRENPRLFESLTLQYKNIERFPGIYTSSISKNLSLGGLSFSSYEFMPLASKVILIFDLKMQKFLRIKAVSKVVWIQKNSSLENYSVGAEFMAMTEEDRHFLGEFLKDRIS